MSNAVAVRDNSEIVAKLVLKGDLSGLSDIQKAEYYTRVCESLELNPLTKPFDILTLNGKQVLYAKREAAEQLRKLNGISVEEMTSEMVGDVFIVRVKGRDKTGRTDMATGAVSVANLKGEALANAFLKAETKAKRRLTLSISGLGMLDETEVETIPGAKVMRDVTPEQSVAQVLEDPELVKGRDYIDALINKALAAKIIDGKRAAAILADIQHSTSVTVLRARYKKLSDEFRAIEEAAQTGDDVGDPPATAEELELY